MALYHKEKIFAELDGKYNEDFAFVGHVLESCCTPLQLFNAIKWTNKYMDRIQTFELKKHSIFESGTVFAYFNTQTVKIVKIYYKKEMELNPISYQFPA